VFYQSSLETACFKGDFDIPESCRHFNRPPPERYHKQNFRLREFFLQSSTGFAGYFPRDWGVSPTSFPEAPDDFEGGLVGGSSFGSH